MTAIVLESELADGVQAIPGTGTSTRARVLVRLFSEPIGILNEALPADGLDADAVSRAILRELGPEVRERIEECGLSWNGTLPTDGLNPPRTPAFLAGRERALREGPMITLAVCTHDRPARLPATLASLAGQAYERKRILVVDNAPSDERTRQVVSEFAGAHSHEVEIGYVREPRVGLSWARNRAVEASDTEVVAWCDDDEVCDRWWAAELARGFVEVPEAGVVAGIVIPAELATPSQEWFEQYCGYTRRGFTRAVFSPATRDIQSPLYPLPPFGIGGNMAWRRDAIDGIGRFDCALGPGTASMDGDDTAALSTLLLAGGTIVYQPTAIVNHYHRADYPELRRLLQGYGRGVGAYYASMLARRPSSAVEMLRLSGDALRDQFSRRGARLSKLDEDFPRELLRANRIGLLQGPFMYARARVHARRLAEAGIAG